jgi:Phage tail lysozyme
MADAIGELFVKLGFKADDSALQDFNVKINDTFNNIKNVSNIVGLQFGANLAQGLLGAATAAGTAATSIENLARNTKMATDDIQKLMGAFRVSNPNATEGQALGVVGSVHDFFVKLTTGRDSTATSAFQYLGGTTPPTDEMDLIRQLREGYSGALEKDKRTHKFLANPFLAQVFGTPDAVAMMSLSQSQFESSGQKNVIDEKKLQQLENEKRAVNQLDMAWDNLERSMLSLAANPLIKIMSAIADELGQISQKGAGGYIHEKEQGIVDVLQNPNSLYLDKAKALAGLPITGLYEMGSAALHSDLSDAPKNMNAKAKHLFYKDLAMSVGFKEHEAEGLVNRLTKESSLNPQAFNPAGGGHGAWGLAQWRGSRLDDFKQFAGHDIQHSSPQEQMQFIYYEMTKGKEQAAGRALMASKNARDAENIIGEKYERYKPAQPLNVNVTQNIHTSDPYLAAELSNKKLSEQIVTSQQMINPRNGTR